MATPIRIFITGATGNIGTAVLKYLTQLGRSNEVYAGVRDLEKAAIQFKEVSGISLVHFDLEDSRTFKSSLRAIHVLFLLRPPHISKVEEFFKPLLKAAKAQGIQKIVFLSVQGAEKSKLIPHHKIELLIRDYGFDFIFVRPSYFMQNLTTALLPEIKDHRRITLPSGDAVFNWVDVQNIGEVISVFLTSFELYKNKAYVISGNENKSFADVALLLSAELKTLIAYRNVNPLRFYLLKRKQGVSNSFALVMTMLHFLPRLQSAPKISRTYYEITKKQPTSLSQFISREKEYFL